MIPGRPMHGHPEYRVEEIFSRRAALNRYVRVDQSRARRHPGASNDLPHRGHGAGHRSAQGRWLPGQFQVPDWVVALVMFGGVVNPLTFVPMAFSTTVETAKAFQWVSFVSFVSLSVGLIAAAAYFIFG